ncbi:MAG: hypothetical protein VX589_15030 [Myxococcota bacterium]|nr:hypothetical protein [Myxococcota bacterium]
MRYRWEAKAGLGLLLCLLGTVALAWAQDRPTVVQAFEAKKTPPKPTGPPKSTHVKAEVDTIPSVGASIFHGRKRLGAAPLRKKFKRDSGPIDIVIKAAGYFPVNTRIFTHTDSKFVIKLTPIEEANTLFGFKEEIPPDGGLPTPDAGITPTPAGPATTTPTAPAPVPAVPTTP